VHVWERKASRQVDVNLREGHSWRGAHAERPMWPLAHWLHQDSDRTGVFSDRAEGTYSTVTEQRQQQKDTDGRAYRTDTTTKCFSEGPEELSGVQ